MTEDRDEGRSWLRRVERKMRQAAKGQAEKRPDWDGRPGLDRQMNKALLFENPQDEPDRLQAKSCSIWLEEWATSLSWVIKGAGG